MRRKRNVLSLSRISSINYCALPEVFTNPCQNFRRLAGDIDARFAVFAAPNEVYETPSRVFAAPFKVCEPPNEVYEAQFEVYEAQFKVYEPQF